MNPFKKHKKHVPAISFLNFSRGNAITSEVSVTIFQSFIRVFLICVFAFLSVESYAQCMSYRIPLAQRVNHSSMIIKGIVKEKIPYKSNDGNIYTLNKIEISAFLKGYTTQKEAGIITIGGQLENEAQITYPSLQLNEGDEYVFFLDGDETKNDNKEIRKSNPELIQCFTYSDAQGGLIYQNEKYSDALSKYTADEETFFSDIEKITNIKAIVLEQNSAKSKQKINNQGARIMSISSFSPTPTKGGTIDAGDYITITGSGFGASAGTVFYKNADDGGATFTASGVASDNISWSDGLIVNKVAAGAGNGPININGAFTSGSSLTVNYSHSAINSSFSGFGSATRQQYYLRNLNTLGGYSFLLNSTSGFSSNTAAVDAFERAIETWRCNSYINWRTDGTTSSGFANDGLSVVLFDNTLPAGVLGRATSRFSGSSTGACNLTNTVWWVTEMDIQMAPDPPVAGFTWQYGPAAPSSSQFDFETVLLHELGHAHGLGHVISSGAVMHYALFNGVATRMPGANEISAAVSKINSSTAPTCFNPTGSGTQMIALTPSNCLTLPIELIDFNAKNVNNDVQLTWSTVSEFNNDFFTVERSKDAINFEAIGKVAGAGNSTGLKKYSLTDYNPYKGTSYYRLKQTDFDKSVTYSRIAEVSIESVSNNSFQLFPNPANDIINIEFYTGNAGVAMLTIAEASGKYVLSENLDVSEGINKATINISSLSKGIYFITVHSKDNDYRTKLIKW